MLLFLLVSSPQVRSVEAALEDLALLEVKLQDDVCLHTRGGCGSERHDGYLRHTGCTREVGVKVSTIEGEKHHHQQHEHHAHHHHRHIGGGGWVGVGVGGCLLITGKSAVCYEAGKAPSVVLSAGTALPVSLRSTCTVSRVSVQLPCATCLISVCDAAKTLNQGAG